MSDKRDDVFRRQARVLKALANESRLKIVDRLGHGECSVGELTKIVGMDRSTVSKHLAVLRAHGIVNDRREGSVVYYELLTPCVLNFFACTTQVIQEVGGPGQAPKRQEVGGPGQAPKRQEVGGPGQAPTRQEERSAILDASPTVTSAEEHT